MRTIHSTIKEYPELADETLVSLAEACKCFPVPLSRPTIERLWRRGQRGVRLETIFLISRRYTSLEAIRRYIERTQRTGDDVPAAPTPSMSKRDLETKKKKYNMPPAGKDGRPAPNN